MGSGAATGADSYIMTWFQHPSTKLHVRCLLWSIHALDVELVRF
jgi:hypothetical protein